MRMDGARMFPMKETVQHVSSLAVMATAAGRAGGKESQVDGGGGEEKVWGHSGHWSLALVTGNP